MRPRKGELCSEKQRILMYDPHGRRLDRVQVIACTDPAVTVRMNWRFGDSTKGEPLTVRVRYPLCAYCAEIHDEGVAEARAEARCS